MKSAPIWRYAFPLKLDILLRSPRRRLHRDIEPVTICIAAASQNIVLLCADRMITAGDIEFEPPTAKITFLTSAIAIMFSGDADLHIEILRELNDEIKRLLALDPTDWIRVREVVDLHIEYRNQVKRKRSEAAILAPLGLSHETWLEKQRIMDAGLVERIASDLINFEIPRLSIIIAGCDLDTDKLSYSHIWTIYDGVPSCRDSVSFASIGSGARHAESQFMLARHSYRKPFPETLLLTFSAKKDAEVAPGVGQGTDLFSIGPYVGQWLQFSDEVLAKLGTEYKTLKRKQQSIRDKATAEVTRYVEEVAKRPIEGQSKPAAKDEGAPLDGEKRGDA